jgi:hypothetical protein
MSNCKHQHNYNCLVAEVKRPSRTPAAGQKNAANRGGPKPRFAGCRQVSAQNRPAGVVCSPEMGAPGRRDGRRRVECQQDAAELKLRAERAIGEFLAKEVGHSGGSRSYRERDLPKGIGRNDSHRWQRIASLPTDMFEEKIAR